VKGMDLRSRLSVYSSSNRAKSHYIPVTETDRLHGYKYRVDIASTMFTARHLSLSFTRSVVQTIQDA
jgi:hypothetical protein